MFLIDQIKRRRRARGRSTRDSATRRSTRDVRARETRARVARVGVLAARRRRIDVLRARTVSTISARKVVRTRTGVRRAECTDVGDVRPRGDVAAHRRTGDVRESHKRHLARTVNGGDD
jgi:hypothetical protein